MLVVDATKFLAGPFGGLVLQDLGARVVKVDPPGGEDFRTVAGASYCALNRDKDQVCIDLKDAAGRDAFAALVGRADALLENMSRQVTDELRLDLPGLRAANPRLVHCHIDGWGAGPLADTPGFDPLLQARSGLMVAQGGAETPVIQPMSLHDIGTGTLAAFGTLVALYARTHLGGGQHVGVALEPHLGRVPGRRVHHLPGPASGARGVHRLRRRRPCAPVRRGGRRLAGRLRRPPTSSGGPGTPYAAPTTPRSAS